MVLGKIIINLLTVDSSITRVLVELKLDFVFLLIVFTSTLHYQNRNNILSWELIAIIYGLINTVRFPLKKKCAMFYSYLFERVVVKWITRRTLDFRW